MKKILITTAAALAASIAIAASSVPANAGGVNVTIGLGGWGNPGWHPGYGYGTGIYLGGPYIQSTWDLHVDWCFDHKGPSYNPNTNKYINQNGKKRTCHSPYA